MYQQYASLHVLNCSVNILQDQQANTHVYQQYASLLNCSVNILQDQQANTHVYQQYASLLNCSVNILQDQQANTHVYQQYANTGSQAYVMTSRPTLAHGPM